MAVSIVVLAHITALLVAALVLVWALAFRTTFLLPSSSGGGASAVTHLDQLYSVLHPLLMVIGFILLAGEGMMAHRWGTGMGWARGARKAAHLWLQGAALGCAISGVWAKFKGKNGALANFYSLHSWMGLLCLLLFAAQWTVGLLKGEGRRARAAVLPWHVFVGFFTYGLAVATAESGLVEKLAFLHTKHGLPRRSPESTLVDVLGLALAVLCGLVIFATIPDSSSNNSGIVSSNGHHLRSEFVPPYKKDDRINGSWVPSS